ncbi:hypothetical protein L7F22_015319 [Adiantum nelumboides]|nr:hypothetical protein [Adiantum nelumboides]
MCAYYRRFIEKFSLIAGPLHDLTKKNVKYVETERKQEAFDKLKQKLTSQPVLVLLDLSKPFEVQCDACGDCLGAVLLQEGHAIAYESRRLSSNEQILGIYEKELLDVLHALDSWKHYLLGTPFILRTDHQFRFSGVDAKQGLEQRVSLFVADALVKHSMVVCL